MAENDQEKQAQEVAEKGRFAATENGDNTIAVSDDGYIGVDAQYQNYANETDKPYASEADSDEGKVEKAVREHVFNNDPDAKRRNPRTGYVTDVRHPSEPRDTAVDKQIEAERRARAAVGGGAQPRPAEQGQAPKRQAAKD